MVLHPAATAVFAALSPLVASSGRSSLGLALVALHAVAAVGVLVCWVAVSWLDPADDAPDPAPCLKVRGFVLLARGFCSWFEFGGIRLRSKTNAEVSLLPRLRILVTCSSARTLSVCVCLCFAMRAHWTRVSFYHGCVFWVWAFERRAARRGRIFAAVATSPYRTLTTTASGSTREFAIADKGPCRRRFGTRIPPNATKNKP
jgi:hypothetical protein